MRPSFFRRKFFINKDLQGKYIFKYFLLFGVGALFFTLIFCFFSSNTLSIVYDDYHLQLGTTPGILLNKILSTQWILMVGGGVIMGIVTLMLTHRIAGPFFRFDATLDEMIKKNLSYRIFLRHNDEGKEMGAKLNEFNKMMSAEINRLKKNSDQIEALFREVDTVLDITKQPLPITSIREINQTSMEILNQFKTVDD